MTSDNIEHEHAAALATIDELIGALQELLYKLENIDDVSTYGLLEALTDHVYRILERYDALE